MTRSQRWLRKAYLMHHPETWPQVAPGVHVARGPDGRWYWVSTPRMPGGSAPTREQAVTDAIAAQHRAMLASKGG